MITLLRFHDETFPDFASAQSGYGLAETERERLVKTVIKRFETGGHKIRAMSLRELYRTRARECLESAAKLHDGESRRTMRELAYCWHRLFAWAADRQTQAPPAEG